MSLSVGIVGSGAIGCYVGGIIKLKGDCQLTLIGRDRLLNEIKSVMLCCARALLWHLVDDR